MPWLSCIISNVLLASILALTAWFVQRCLGRHALARVLWILVLVKLVTPPLVSVPLGKSPNRLACALGSCGCGPHAPIQTLMRDTLPWVLLAAWSAGATATSWNAWRRWTRFRRLIAHASPAPPEWQTLAVSISAQLSIRRPPEILAVPGRLPPLVVPGGSRPRMLLPIALIGQLNASQRSALLLHELIHIKRGDHFVRMLELAIHVVYWWLPIVGSICRQLRACEETYCDAEVVAHLPQARRDYAELLLDVLDFANPLPSQAVPQASAMSAASDLEQRLRAILDAPRATRRIWPTGVIAMGLACAILPCELRYESVARPTPAAVSIEGEAAATSIEREAAAGPTLFPNIDRELSVSCCPS